MREESINKHKRNEGIPRTNMRGKKQSQSKSRTTGVSDSASYSSSFLIHADFSQR